jgi:hypothetical protein
MIWLENSPICNWFSFGFIPRHAYVFRYWPSVSTMMSLFHCPTNLSSVWVSFAVNCNFYYIWSLVRKVLVDNCLYFIIFHKLEIFFFMNETLFPILFSELTTGHFHKVSSWLISFDLNFELVLINQKLKRIIDLIFCYWDPIWQLIHSFSTAVIENEFFLNL